jgi:hypothetical protein
MGNIDNKLFSLSESDLKTIGKNRNAVKFPPELGGEYVGSLEVFHQLHCLVSQPVASVVTRILRYHNSSKPDV